MKNTYQIKYWVPGAIMKTAVKYITADSRNEAVAIFKDRFGGNLKVKKTKKIIDNNPDEQY